MNSSATQFIQRTYQQPYSPTTIQRVADKDSKVADSYNAFIWELASKFTNSTEEAEAAVQEMNVDIQRCTERGVKDQPIEDRLVARIAWRRLLKFLQ